MSKPNYKFLDGINICNEIIDINKLKKYSSSYFYLITYSNGIKINKKKYDEIISTFKKNKFYVCNKEQVLNLIIKNDIFSKIILDIEKLYKSGTYMFGDVFEPFDGSDCNCKIERLGYGATKIVFGTNILGIKIAIFKLVKIQELNILKIITEHPYILTLYYFDDVNKYMFTEYCPYTFRTGISKVRNELKKYTKQILKALKFMHDNYILHRDIKLDNILIGFDNNARLADFDISGNYIDNKSEINDYKDEDIKALYQTILIISISDKITVQNYNDEKQISNWEIIKKTKVLEKYPQLMPGLYYMSHRFMRHPNDQEYEFLINKYIVDDKLKDLLNNLLINNYTIEQALQHEYYAE